MKGSGDDRAERAGEGRPTDDQRRECRICWYVYDPTKGDALNQVEANTPFTALPEDWHCPQCDADRSMFLVVEDS